MINDGREKGLAAQPKQPDSVMGQGWESIMNSYAINCWPKGDVFSVKRC